MDIEVWSDIVCPWCYLGNVRLKKAIELLDDSTSVSVRTRSFELNPDASTVPRSNLVYLSEKFGITEDEAAQMDARLAGLAAEDGVPFVTDRPTASSFDLHRVVWLARTYEVGEQLFDELQFTLFGDGANVFDHEYLLSKATALGVPAERVEAVLSGDEFAAEVRRDEIEAQQIGVAGVPFAVIDRRYAIPGAASVEQYNSVLSRFESPEDG
jgi:predicted DsbA family dithiol-disulfide isomerase